MFAAEGQREIRADLGARQTGPGEEPVQRRPEPKVLAAALSQRFVQLEESPHGVRRRVAEPAAKVHLLADDLAAGPHQDGAGWLRPLPPGRIVPGDDCRRRT